MKQAYVAPQMKMVVMNPEESLFTACVTGSIAKSRDQMTTYQDRLVSMKRERSLTSDSFSFFRTAMGSPGTTGVG